MMASYVNVFSPMTQEGQAMTNAVDAYFLSQASPNQRADREALARLRDAKIQTEREKQAKYRAEIDRLKGQEEGLGNFLGNYAASFPGLNEPEINYYFDTGEIPVRQAEGPPLMEAGGALEYPTINAFGPETERELQAGRRLYSMMLASDRDKLTPQGMTEGLGDLSGQLTDRDLLTGKVDPTLFSTMRGELPYSQSGGRSINRATGEVVVDAPTLRELETEAEFNVSRADLNAEREKTETARQDSLKRRADAAMIRAESYRDRPGTTRQTKPPKISNADRVAMRTVAREQLTYLSGFDEKDSEGDPIFVNVPPVIENEILDIAENLFQDPSSGFYGNVRGAVMEAINIVSPGGYEFTGETGTGQAIQDFFGWDQEDRDFKEGSETVIKRPSAPSVMQFPQSDYFDRDQERYTWDEIVQEAKDQGVTPQELIEAYGLTPGA